ncbi:MAG: family 1 glycosylhydrolase, partial [Bacteroidales bacterium]|nr:family 1 glycosylhydrolase [Bacteroidales bacterium]
DLWNNSWWMDPVLLGKYPEDGIKLFGDDAPEIKPGDMEIIHQPVDYCGHNVYTARRFKAGIDGNPVGVPPEAGYNVTSQDDWEVVPEGMYWTLKFMSEKYSVPIMITENGHQNLDAVSLDGKVHDPQRIDYLHRHILQLKNAMDEGVDVRGYFAWTLLDNFEWSFGYRVRVGLVYTDYKTLERIPKDSFKWYKYLIASNGMNL